MEVIKNVLLNWVLPIAGVILVLVLVEEVFTPGSVQVQGEAPAFELVDTAGERVSLESFRGRPVLLNFWATWCGPCKQELPTLTRFAARHPELPVLGLAVDSGDPETLRRARTDLKIGFPVLVTSDAVQRRYSVNTIPTTILVDAQGQMRQRHTGVISERRLRRWLEGLE